MQFLQLNADSLFYLLNVDGLGEYAMKNEDGERCLFVFTSQEAVTKFVDLMELPEHTEFIALQLPAREFADRLDAIIDSNPMIALDPETDCDFRPILTQHLLDALAAFRVRP